jgi:hypothetical protein
MVAGLLALPAAVPAQETRAELIAQQKAAKAAAAGHDQPGLLERGLNLVQEEAGAAPIGFYPYVSSIYSGSWFAFGGGYRYPVGDTGVIDVEGAYSLRGYWRVQERFRLPRFARDRGSLQLRHTTLDAPTVKYFGVGADSSEDDRAQFGFRRADFAAEFRYQLRAGVSVGADLAYDLWNTREGGSGAPSIETIFTPEDSPGLGQDPAFLRTRVLVDADWRDGASYTRRGGRAIAAFTRFAASSGDPFDFARFDLSASQHFPVARENWVIAVRGLFSATSAAQGQQVPYFLLPMLGESSDELRGFTTFRFRDRHRLLLTGEYRWLPSHYLDLALFVDAGTVAADLGDLTLSGMEKTWGISARAHTPQDTLFHVTAARSREGWRFIVGAGQVF